MSDRKGTTISFYIPDHEARHLSALDGYGPRSSAIRRLIKLAYMVGGLDKLEMLVFRHGGDTLIEA